MTDDLRVAHNLKRLVTVVADEETGAVYFEEDAGAAWRTKDRIWRNISRDMKGSEEGEIEDAFLVEICRWANDINGAGDDKTQEQYVTIGIAEAICCQIELVYEMHKKNCRPRGHCQLLRNQPLGIGA